MVVFLLIGGIWSLPGDRRSRPRRDRAWRADAAVSRRRSTASGWRSRRLFAAADAPGRGAAERRVHARGVPRRARRGRAERGARARVPGRPARARGGAGRPHGGGGEGRGGAPAARRRSASVVESRQERLDRQELVTFLLRLVARARRARASGTSTLTRLRGAELALPADRGRDPRLRDDHGASVSPATT